jgi:hypothetical protein
MTNRRRADAEISRGGCEGPVAGDANKNRQMAEKISIHS